MSLTVQNPYAVKAEVDIIHPDGTLNCVHIQPHATVKLRGGDTIHPNSKARYPRLRIVDTLAQAN